MKKKSIIIIGAGMGGLASGIYGQMNGYQTQIFEMHTMPGGQCTSWKRQGYTFDACIHHLFGCDPSTRIYSLWNELGAMPRELVRTNECVSVLSPEGELFHDYYDPDRLEQHLNELAPADFKVIREYTNAIRSLAKHDLWGDVMMGTARDKIRVAPALIASLKWFALSMQQFAWRFSNPFLKQAFALLVYSIPIVPFFVHVARHAHGYRGDIQWPIGGSIGFAKSIEKRYRELGGEIRYHQKVDRILVEHNRAVGVRLADGSEHRADIIISNADGRKTLKDMLEGNYMNNRLRIYCMGPADETNWAVNVFLGVNRDLSQEPSALVMLLDKPITIAHHENESLEMQLYGFDNTMAPSGKGIIKVELVSSYSYWKKLYKERQRYKEEKEKVAEQVIDILDSYFKGIKNQIEVIDVPTLMTWERFMGGTHGFANSPNKRMSLLSSLFGREQEMMVPGLSNFYFVGQWMTSSGALFTNALSGRKVIQAICKQDKKRFTSTPG